MNTTISASFSLIDGQYMRPGRASAYLVEDNGEAAFFDNCTRFSVPYLLEGLEQRGLAPEQVKYIVVSHIHLDHSGGTAELFKHCPNATVLAHPRATRHLADPARLVAGAKQIYGEQMYAELYGEIEPLPEDRIQAMDDGTHVTIGNRTWDFYDAPGHAKHHFVVHDRADNVVLAGDAFGTSYPQLQTGQKPFVTYVAAPPDFEPEAAIATVRRIAELNPAGIYVTHFGPVVDIPSATEQLVRCVEAMAAASKRAAETPLKGDDLVQFCENENLTILRNELTDCGLDMDDPDIYSWATTELLLNKQGLAHYAEQIREGKA